MFTAGPTIRIPASDYERLTDLLSRLPASYLGKANRLADELDRAEVIPDQLMPKHVVAMNSTVVYEDLDTGKFKKIQLTYPDDANLDKGCVSVLAPVGTALLGLEVGETIKWPLPDGRVGRLRVRTLH